MRHNGEASTRGCHTRHAPARWSVPARTWPLVPRLPRRTRRHRCSQKLAPGARDRCRFPPLLSQPRRSRAAPVAGIQRHRAPILRTGRRADARRNGGGGYTSCPRTGFHDATPHALAALPSDMLRLRPHPRPWQCLGSLALRSVARGEVFGESKLICGVHKPRRATRRS